MSKTTNYGLEKPEQDDYYDVDVFNNNADIVDGKLATIADQTKKLREDSDSHLSDKVAHVTAEERKSWNAKQDASTAINIGNIADQSVYHARNANLSTHTRLLDESWELKADKYVLAPICKNDETLVTLFGSSGDRAIPVLVEKANSATNASVATKINDGAVEWTPSKLKTQIGDRYTKSEADGRFINNTGDSMSGTLSMGEHEIKDVYAVTAVNNTGDSRVLWLRSNNAVKATSTNNTTTIGFHAGYIFCTSCTQSSYRGVKENIRELTKAEAEKVYSAPVRIFDYRAGFGGDRKNVSGFIVDEIQDIFPEAVVIPKDWDEAKFNPLLGDVENGSVPGVDYAALVPALFGAVQDLNDRVKALEAEIEALKNS